MTTTCSLTHNTAPLPSQSPVQMYLWFGVAAAFVIVLSLVAALIVSDPRAAKTGGDDGVLGGDFVLQSANGDVALADYRGKVVVLYFGFLNCPEVCPASLGVIKGTLNKLSEEQRQQVQPMLISIDPARDTVESLAEFTRFFHQQIIGLTGTPQAVQAVANDYGAYFKAVDSESVELDYVFEHTSRYYVINPQGELVDAMRHSTTANELSARIRTLL